MDCGMVSHRIDPITRNFWKFQYLGAMKRQTNKIKIGKLNYQRNLVLYFFIPTFIYIVFLKFGPKWGQNCI